MEDQLDYLISRQNWIKNAYGLLKVYPGLPRVKARKLIWLQGCTELIFNWICRLNARNL